MESRSNLEEGEEHACRISKILSCLAFGKGAALKHQVRAWAVEPDPRLYVPDPVLWSRSSVCKAELTTVGPHGVVASIE